MNDRGEEMLSDRDVHSFANCLAERQDARRPAAEIDEDLVADGCDYAVDDFARTEWPEGALAGLDLREQLFHRLWVDCHHLAAGKRHATDEGGSARSRPPRADRGAGRSARL